MFKSTFRRPGNPSNASIVSYKCKPATIDLDAIASFTECPPPHAKVYIPASAIVHQAVLAKVGAETGAKGLQMKINTLFLFLGL